MSGLTRRELLKAAGVAGAAAALPSALAGPAGSFLAGLGRLRAEFTVRFLNPAQPKEIGRAHV